MLFHSWKQSEPSSFPVSQSAGAPSQSCSTTQSLFCCRCGTPCSKCSASCPGRCRVLVRGHWEAGGPFLQEMAVVEVDGEDSLSGLADLIACGCSRYPMYLLYCTTASRQDTMMLLPSFCLLFIDALFLGSHMVDNIWHDTYCSNSGKTAFFSASGKLRRWFGLFHRQ